MNVTERNFASIEQALNKLNIMNNDLLERVVKLERDNSMLHIELNTQKQLAVRIANIR